MKENKSQWFSIDLAFTYTCWTLLFVIGVVLYTIIGGRVNGGIWRAAFSLFCAAAVCGTILTFTSLKEYREAYDMSTTHIICIDMAIHVIPFLLLVPLTYYMKKRSKPDALCQWTVIFCFAFTYICLFGTSKYPAMNSILLMLFVSALTVALSAGLMVV